MRRDPSAGSTRRAFFWSQAIKWIGRLSHTDSVTQVVCGLPRVRSWLQSNVPNSAYCIFIASVLRCFEVFYAGPNN